MEQNYQYLKILRDAVKLLGVYPHLSRAGTYDYRQLTSSLHEIIYNKLRIDVSPHPCKQLPSESVMRSFATRF